MASRILFHESHNVGFYGAAQSLYHLILGLDRARFEPHLACSQEGPLLERCGDAGIPTHVTGQARRRIRRLGRLGNLVNSLREARSVFRWLGNNPCDIVHCNRLRSVVVAGLPARLRGLPVIWHYRRGRSMGLVELFGGIISTRIIAVSESLQDQLQSHAVARFLGIVPKVSVVYNGVPAAKFSPKPASTRLLQEFGFQEHHKIVGVIAVLIPRKGIELFIQMAKVLAAEYPDSRFLVVGGVPDNQPDSYFGRLQALADDLVQSRRLIFTGWRDDIPDILSLLSVLVHPSYSEGMARAVIEALAAGVPVVATDTEGAREAVAVGETGYVARIGNVPELLTFTKRMLDSPELVERMGEAARQRALELFSVEAMVHSIEAIYERISREQNR